MTTIKFNSKSISPKDIYDVTMSVFRQSGCKNINQLCKGTGFHRYTVERTLKKLRDSKQWNDRRSAYLHTLQFINKLLHIEYMVIIPKDVPLKNGLKRRWKLNLDKVIDLNMLRYIQNSWFNSEGKPLIMPDGTRNSIPKNTILSNKNLSSVVYISNSKWNKAIYSNREPSRDTRKMTLGKFLHILKDLNLELVIKYKDKSKISQSLTKRG